MLNSQKQGIDGTVKHCGYDRSCGCGQRSNRRCLEKTGFFRKNWKNTGVVAVPLILYTIKTNFSLNVYTMVYN